MIQKNTIKLVMFLVLCSVFANAKTNTLQTLTSVYKPNDLVSVKVDAALSGDEDWVGVYPKNANSDWANVVSWNWVPHNGTVALSEIKKSMPVGAYEARLFFHNNYQKKASYPFTVGISNFKTSKAKYAPNETVSVTVNVPLSGDKDWVGIFPKNADNKWSNAIAWNWISNKGTFSLSRKRKAMPAGEYEVRLFWHNAYGADVKAKESFGFSVGGATQNSKKKLILVLHSGGWAPVLANNLVPRRDVIRELPFSGYGLVGNSFTNIVMARGVTVNYDDIVEELKGGERTTKGIKAFNAGKSNFLTVWMRFPGDMWDANAWNKVTQNFKTLAKVAKNLGFAGIIYDDEAYDLQAHYLINYDYNTYFDYADKAQTIKSAYKTPNKTFLEHTEKITALFKTIMEGMVAEFPSIDVLYYHSPAEGHIAANKAGKYGGPLIRHIGLEREHELIGAMFLGLKRGLSAQASLHDMGEDYTLNTKEHFEHAYQWRKHTIASDETNDNVNKREHWIIPKEDRATWANDVTEGFMVTNFPNTDPRQEFDTTNKVGVDSMKNILENALNRSDEYVIFYSASSSPHGQGVGKIKLDWLQKPSAVFSVNPQWKQMMTDVYNEIK